jgi:CHASE3 domain sensor protein/ABC-type transporter Mla subunit MlaD
MYSNWTFGRRLATGFSLAGLILLIVAAVSYKTTEDLIRNQVMVSHTHQVRTNLALILSDITDAEAGQRGFILTGIDSYLEPYVAAVTSIEATMARVKQLTVDNPNQQRRITALTPLIHTRLERLKDGIDLRRNQGFDPALKVILTDQGRSLMAQIRGLIEEADREEMQLLEERRAEANASAAFAKNISLWGSLGGALLVAAIGWAITQSLVGMIGSAVGQIQSSSAELQAAATQQATGAKEQSTATSEITTTISELLATSRQIAESSRRVSQIAEQTADGSRKGQKTVDTTHESIASIRRQVDQIVNHMLELGKKSQEIGSVLDIVSELAEQTNILAINATIEAAGAGESGKRFAVVADEIRKLADRVGGSAKEIRGLIEDVRGAVNTTVMATETGSKSVDAGSRLFGDVASAFNQISDLVSTTTEAAREIELSTKQQTSAVEQVNIAIANVAQASKETEASSGQTLQTSTQLTVLSKDLLRLIRPQTA